MRKKYDKFILNKYMNFPRLVIYKKGYGVKCNICKNNIFILD